MTELIYEFILYKLEPALIAKSTIILDVKPWDDETDMAALEQSVRSIETDGLLWGSCKSIVISQKLVSITLNLS